MNQEVRAVVNQELKLLFKCKNKKQKSWQGAGVRWGWGQGGYDQRIEVIVKMQKESRGGGGGPVGGSGWM